MGTDEQVDACLAQLAYAGLIPATAGAVSLRLSRGLLADVACCKPSRKPGRAGAADRSDQLLAMLPHESAYSAQRV